MRDKVSRSPDEHSAALAAANAPVLRDAARALIRNCDTLQLAASAAAAEGEAGGGGGGPTLAAVLCFDEVQVQRACACCCMWRRLCLRPAPGGASVDARCSVCVCVR